MKRLLLLVLFVVAACGGAPEANTPVDLAKLRSSAKGSGDADKVGRWLLDEMIAPGGTAKNAAEARADLEKAKSNRGLYAGIAGGLYDETHGDPKKASEWYVRALVAAGQKNEDAQAPLIAWLAAHHLIALRGSVSNLWETNKAALEPLVNKPGTIGWRALAELYDWSTAEAFDKAEVTGDQWDAFVTTRMGCAKNVRIAGPFGRGSAPDRRRAPGRPSRRRGRSRGRKIEMRGSIPRVLKTERHRCFTASTDKSEEGIFYAETFIEVLGADRDLLIAVQGSIAMWIDDQQVMSRDLRDWGVWQRFGATVHVPKGRHRVLARILNDAGSIRLMNLDGTAATGLDTDSDARKPYGLSQPVQFGNPNPVSTIVDQVAHEQDPKLTPLVTMLAAQAAWNDGLDDVAMTILTPIVTPKDAAPVTLLTAARISAGDPAFPDQVRRTTQKDFYTRASAADPRLWYARLWLLSDDAESRGATEAVEPLKKLVAEFPGEPEPAEQLSRLYGRLSWRAERMKSIQDTVARFPDDRDALGLYLVALEDDGSMAEADKVAARVKKLDADAEVDLDRAIARRDWKAAIAELRRLEKRRPDRKEIAGRIADVLMRSGDPTAAAEQLKKALAKNPKDSGTRLALADLAYAKGDTEALQKAFADALQAGGKGVELRAAIDLLEGATLLDPYRQDGRAVIREFEAWEKRGKHMEGNAARVLDYAALWVHPDGSSEMLEHEILRMQSQEAIGQESEQKPPDGLVLRLRVIKPDGSILEPDVVAGKATLTMPHLNVGDYIEIEHITPLPGEGGKGKHYRGPQWFFREADKGYWRSEFVVISPKDKALEIETVGSVPTPKIADKQSFTERRWRVDESPPAPEEPDSVNPREFLPSVRIGWGVSLDETLLRYVDAVSEETPLDPRVRKLVRSKAGSGSKDDQARALYKWISDDIQDGQEADGRRVLEGRSGNRQAAFLYAVHLMGISAELALVKNRIAAPPTGKMSEVETYENVVTRLSTDKKPRWLTVRDKFAPYGYMPAELRGQPAIRLVNGVPRDTTPPQGDADGVLIQGKATLRPDGSASIEISQSYSGRMGIGLRAVFDRVAESKREELVETRLLASNIPGAQLKSLKIENAEDLGAPLVLRMKAEVSQLARPAGDKMLVKSLFPVNIAQIASLPTRQTPLLLASSSHVDVRFEIQVDGSLRLPASLPTGTLKDGDRSITVSDKIEGRSIMLNRLVDIPAGRVQPGADYAKFVTFTQNADQLLEREIAVGR